MSRQSSKQLTRQSSKNSFHSDSISLSSFDISGNGSMCESDQNDVEEIGIGMEASSKGKIKGSITANYFAAGANYFWLFVLGIGFIITQLLASAADYWVAVW